MGCSYMAQLIKLQDYVSRYEMDVYRYPGQFIRLKRENWEKLHSIWKMNNEKIPLVLENSLEDHRKRGIPFLKKWLNRHSLDTEDDRDPFDEQPEFPESIRELKHYFLDRIFPFQIKWASSTIRESSIVEKQYYDDPLLKYLLQSFPDIFLIMYYPIFKLKKAPVEAEIIILTPLKIYCVHVVEFEEDVNVIAGGQRVWYIENSRINKKMLSPLISLKRTERIVRSILGAYNIRLPVEKIVLSRFHPIEYHSEPYLTSIVGRDDYESWYSGMKRIRSPLKYIQLKAGEALLKHCQTTAMKRPEWEMEEEEPLF